MTAIFHSHSVVSGIDRMKVGIGIPCFVKVEIFNSFISGILFQNSFGIVAYSVVSGIGQSTHPDMRFFIFVFDQRVSVDPFFD